MLVLEIGKKCPYRSKCPYNDNCCGARSNRESVFTCDYVDSTGNIKEGMYRNPMDKTGKQKVLME